MDGDNVCRFGCVRTVPGFKMLLQIRTGEPVGSVTLFIPLTILQSYQFKSIIITDRAFANCLIV